MSEMTVGVARRITRVRVLLTEVGKTVVSRFERIIRRSVMNMLSSVCLFAIQGIE